MQLLLISSLMKQPLVPDLQPPTRVIHGIGVDEYDRRRQNVATKLLHLVSMEQRDSEARKPAQNVHFVIIPSAQKRFMVDKIPYFYRQSTDMVGKC